MWEGEWEADRCTAQRSLLCGVSESVSVFVRACVWLILVPTGENDQRSLTHTHTHTHHTHTPTQTSAPTSHGHYSKRQEGKSCESRACQ